MLTATRVLARAIITLGVALSLGACGGSGSGAGSTTNPPPPNPPPPNPPPAATVDAPTDHAFVTDHFSGSENCAVCHDGLNDAAGTDVSIVADWQASMMANSSRDPFWRAKVASEIRRNPGIASEIEATCSRCHAPMAHVEAIFATTEATLFDDGVLHPDNPLFDAAADGVSCTLCHQIEDSAVLGTATGFSGGFEIPFNFGADRELYGQYANPLQMPMVNQVAFTPVGSPHISESEVCATCHNLSTPVVDASGNLSGAFFPEQMVYTEWENSGFTATQSCVSCHMQTVSGDVRIATRPMNGLNPRPDFSRHQFVGGNTYMLDLVARNSTELQVTATGFETLVDETLNLLGTAASLDVEAVARDGDDFVFTVRVTNLAGHKFPTSYPSRRAWLHVTVTDAAGAVVFESGAIDGAGRIAGVNSDADVTDYERHHRTISSSEQVQVYETIMEDQDSRLTYTLLEAASYRKDNRLLPNGMDKAAVPATIRPRGDAFTDPDFVDGGDLVDYRISGLNAGDMTIRAELNYQVLTFAHAEDLFRDAEEPHVAAFQALNASSGRRFETVSSVSQRFNF
ncbi:MAG: hypothetical protein WBM76_14530 [Woeseiaceae bacterium]